MTIDEAKAILAKPPSQAVDLHWVACELSHDLREGLDDRVRWNNRAMLLMHNMASRAEARAIIAEHNVKRLVEAAGPLIAGRSIDLTIYLHANIHHLAATVKEVTGG